jgi:hypothetical protein
MCKLEKAPHIEAPSFFPGSNQSFLIQAKKFLEAVS